MRYRTRTVSFRVSDEEFERLRSFCNAQGGHNVSELARTAVQELMKSYEGGGDPLASRLEAIEQQIQRLDSILTQHGEK